MVLFEAEKEDYTIKQALRDADLSGADLSVADFYHAQFYGHGGNTKIRKSQVDDFFKALGVVVEE